ncbi:MAG TPA: hypothetical protein VNT26_07850, partial [Candidatus Sulfotelmatobacter sp.]|nr:hypothetical protein [Candidatus Sulfotelmatobacter sp.]
MSDSLALEYAGVQKLPGCPNGFHIPSIANYVDLPALCKEPLGKTAGVSCYRRKTGTTQPLVLVKFLLVGFAPLGPQNHFAICRSQRR